MSPQRGRPLTPILVEAKPNNCWSLDDQLVRGRRLRILNLADDKQKTLIVEFLPHHLSRVAEAAVDNVQAMLLPSGCSRMAGSPDVCSSTRGRGVREEAHAVEARVRQALDDLTGRAWQRVAPIAASSMVRRGVCSIGGESCASRTIAPLRKLAAPPRASSIAAAAQAVAAMNSRRLRGSLAAIRALRRRFTLQPRDDRPIPN